MEAERITQLQAIIRSARDGTALMEEREHYYPCRVRGDTIEFLHPNLGWQECGRAGLAAFDMGVMCLVLSPEKAAELEGVVARRVARELSMQSPHERRWGT